MGWAEGGWVPPGPQFRAPRTVHPPQAIIDRRTAMWRLASSASEALLAEMAVLPRDVPLRWLVASFRIAYLSRGFAGHFGSITRYPRGNKLFFLHVQKKSLCR